MSVLIPVPHDRVTSFSYNEKKSRDVSLPVDVIWATVRMMVSSIKASERVQFFHQCCCRAFFTGRGAEISFITITPVGVGNLKL